MNTQLGNKQLKRLETIRALTDNVLGMYPGAHLDLSPRNYEKLVNAGYAEYYYPHNPVHTTRVVITEKGRAALDAQQGKGEE